MNYAMLVHITDLSRAISILATEHFIKLFYVLAEVAVLQFSRLIVSTVLL